MEIKPILLDTNAYTAFKRNVSDAVEVINNTPLIGLNSVILGELLGGFAVGTKEAINRDELKQFLSIEKVKVFVIDNETAEYYAMVYRGLRTKGNPIPTNDMWIASTALQHNLSLFSYDKHFQAVNRLVTGTCLSDLMVK
ncbi:MAG: type II toxin-antitoxin system VapC family toxin [Okeania sp. SIO3B5]|uniref:type II toxin-antitoxin system VapC family toxin n=1 Tax=Okeania sp. SIO3B5 TaxID=2607811 RepID=UPI001401A7C2|nr:type II toxin-antitoxin system VapC family toxin [Okeania sp. SIO3B5]NEO57303.1 type II toxin-antitoxin system VapC family toxin [Okeania sp. SIO3B5]